MNLVDPITFTTFTLVSRMNYFKSFLITIVLMVSLTIAYGQEYFYEDEDQELARERRSAEDYILEGNEDVIGSNLRYRRDDENVRQRRQGNHGNGGHEGITGPVHTFVKTDEHAHFKWGVRHHVGHEYAGRR